MRHRKKSVRFSRSRAQKKALVKSLLRALIINERISTTTARAKYLRAEADRLVTWAKRDSLANRRLAYRILGDHSLVKRLFDDIGPRYKDVSGGYTRSFRLNNRRGDGASVSLIELTKIVKKEKALKKKSRENEAKKTPKEEEKAAIPLKEAKPKKGFISGVRKIFKKEKNAT
jgi:large subunit ribosomal protein L17